MHSGDEMRRSLQPSVFRERGTVPPPLFTGHVRHLAHHGVSQGKNRGTVPPPKFTGHVGHLAHPGVLQGKSTSLRPKSAAYWKVRKAEKRSSVRRKANWKAKHNKINEPFRLPNLQSQNRLNTPRFYSKKFRVPAAPGAPRNTTSFLMRAKTSGGLASLISPSPATPAVIPTPILSPTPRYREGLADEVNKEWGVNGYGSMNGLIRLRSTESGLEDDDCEDDVDQNAHAQSVQQLEQRLDQDLSRFEMIYPSSAPLNNPPNLLETRIDDQDSHIAHLEEENLTLKERLYLMEHELDDLRRRMQLLQGGAVSDEQAEVCSERSIGDSSYARD